jgi:hypothetical protein
MSEKKKKEEVHVSPPGILHFPYLQKPRGYKGDEDKLAYDTQLILEGAAAAEFAAFVDSKMREAEELHPGCPVDRPPITPVLDGEKNVVQGKTAFKFRVSAFSKNRKTGEIWNRKPAIVDANGELCQPLMDNETRIGPGTKAKIAFTAYLRKNRGAAGVTLQPVGVQVIELVELGGRRVEDLGFGKVEGGFVANTQAGGGGDDASQDGDDIPF